MPKIAFCLSGGGAKGDFEVGALTFLLQRNIVPNIVCGTSVGAVNAVAIAEGPTGIDRLRKIWHSLKGDSDMYLPEPWLTNILSTPSQSGGVNMDLVKSVLFTPAFPVFTPLFAFLLNDIINKLVALLEDYQLGKIQGCFNLEPTRKRLIDQNDGIKPSLIANSGIKLRLAMVCLQDGDTYYVNENGYLFKGHANIVPADAPTVGLASATLASSSIPIIFKPIELAGKHFVDGGIREVVPVRAATELGAEHIYAIVASETRLARDFFISDETKEDLQQKGYSTIEPKMTIDSIGKRALGCMLDELTNDDLRLQAKVGKNAILWVIRPTIVPEIHDALTINPDLIRIMMDYGFMRAWDIVGVPGAGMNPLLNFPQNAELRKAYMENTDEIISLRLQAIALEQTCGKVVGAPKSGSGNIHFAFYPDKIAELRKVKHAIAQAINTRAKLQLFENVALTPSKSLGTVIAWAHQWEAPPKTSELPATPFSSMPAMGGETIAATTPPKVNL